MWFTIIVKLEMDMVGGGNDEKCWGLCGVRDKTRAGILIQNMHLMWFMIGQNEIHFLIRMDKCLDLMLHDRVKIRYMSLGVFHRPFSDSAKKHCSHSVGSWT